MDVVHADAVVVNLFGKCIRERGPGVSSPISFKVLFYVAVSTCTTLACLSFGVKCAQCVPGLTVSGWVRTL